MSELSRIERVYGCVAEYNRSRSEERYVEPTEAEIAENERQLKKLNDEIENLDGTPSDFIIYLVSEWERAKPQDNNDMESFYAIKRWGRERDLNILSEIAEHYDVEMDEKWETFYRVPAGRYAIKVEYYTACEIKSKAYGNLTLEQFKKIFCDLHYARLAPTMSHNGEYVGNVSLGHLLRFYIKEA